MIEDILQLNPNFHGGGPLKEDYIFGRGSFVEGNLKWKTTFDGKQSLKEDNK